MRSTPVRASRRSVSSPRTICASLPKKIAASSSSRGGIEVARNVGGFAADQQNDDFLAHKLGSVQLWPAPSRGKPLGADEREDDFALLCSLLQRLLPALAGRDTPLGIEIKEDVIPAVRNQPVTQLDCPVIIDARMAYENAGHGTAPVKWPSLDSPLTGRQEPRLACLGLE